MNIKQLSSVAAVSAIAFGTTIPALAETSAPSKVTFSCEVNNGVPTTVLRAENTQKTIFNWQSERLSQTKNPLELCNDVTAKLNSYSADENNDLSMLTFKADVLQKNTPMICATDDLATCNMMLFTLSPTDNAGNVANGVLDDILDKNLQATRTQSNERGLQSVSHSINIWELILGRKVIKTF